MIVSSSLSLLTRPRACLFCLLPLLLLSLSLVTDMDDFWATNQREPYDDVPVCRGSYDWVLFVYLRGGVHPSVICACPLPCVCVCVCVYVFRRRSPSPPRDAREPIDRPRSPVD
eukprot:Opistho-2@57039